jgi:hypothetical protein
MEERLHIRHDFASPESSIRKAASYLRNSLGITPRGILLGLIHDASTTGFEKLKALQFSISTVGDVTADQSTGLAPTED